MERVLLLYRYSGSGSQERPTPAPTCTSGANTFLFCLRGHGTVHLDEIVPSCPLNAASLQFQKSSPSTTPAPHTPPCRTSYVELIHLATLHVPLVQTHTFLFCLGGHGLVHLDEIVPSCPLDAASLQFQKSNPSRVPRRDRSILPPGRGFSAIPEIGPLSHSCCTHPAAPALHTWQLVTLQLSHFPILPLLLCELLFRLRGLGIVHLEEIVPSRPLDAASLQFPKSRPSRTPNAHTPPRPPFMCGSW